jgi:hypothetical protein
MIDEQSIVALVQLALAVFQQVFGMFNHPTAPVPVANAQHITTALHAVPGITDVQKQVITAAVGAAADATAKAAQAKPA